ncbi:MAG: hypothetical protein HQL31_08265 [Planctomycetes bacterium]|nr:hypothetical protein [Planctomycetota bacterium]
MPIIAAFATWLAGIWAAKKAAVIAGVTALLVILTGFNTQIANLVWGLVASINPTVASILCLMGFHDALEIIIGFFAFALYLLGYRLYLRVLSL